MSKIAGSCLCGKVKYHLNTEIKNVVNCHCNFCRSHSGAAFSTYAALPHSALEITSGQDSLHSYKIERGAEEGGTKHFCRECGTPIFNLNARYPGACMIYFGTLERAQNMLPKINIWRESKLAWIDSLSSLPSVDQGIERK